MRRHLYLDIDGVLNAPPTTHVQRAWPDHRNVDGTIAYSPELIRQVNNLLERLDGVEVFWLSSWEEESPDFGRTVGLEGSEHWPWLPGCGGGRGFHWEKYHAIKEHTELTQPDVVAWCDDELRTEPVVDEWARERGWLPISPTAVLLPEHLQALEEHFTN